MPIRHRSALVLALLLALAGPSAAQKVQIEEKVEDLEARAAKDSVDPAAHYNLAMGYWSKKRFAEAERSLRTAIAIDPEFAEAYLALSRVRHWDNDFIDSLDRQKGDSALPRYLRAANRNYSKAFLLDPFVDIKILGGTYRIYNHSRFFQGFQDLVEGKYDKAYETFDKEMRFWGGHGGADSAPPIVLWLHGLAGAHSNQFDPAIHDMEVLIAQMAQAARQDSSDAIPLAANEYRYLQAALYQRAGRTDQAVALYREVAQNDLGNFMAHVQLARIFEAGRDYQNALAERQRAVESNPDDPVLMMDFGVTLGKAGQFADAADKLHQAIEANPRDARPLFWLGIAEQQLGHADAARDAFQRYVTLAPARYDRQIALARDRLAQLK